jgi:uncharacterized membrane protein YfcA
MIYLVICLAALAGSALTFFSGFGLGTLMVPVFALFFPIDVSIALTAVVHFLNNLFKLLLIGAKARIDIILRFGIPSLLAAFAGAWVLTQLGDAPPLYSYGPEGDNFVITPLKIIIASLLLVFVLFDLVPRLSRLEFDQKLLPLGGLLSGFFGGLSGNHGALRSAFLIRARLEKEVYIATGVVIACLVDIARLGVYSKNIFGQTLSTNLPLMAAATSSAFIGAFVGSRLIKKITLRSLQYFVGVMLIIFSLLLGTGLI